MANATATKTKKFTIHYPVTTIHQVTIERAEDITEEELLQSVTRDDLVGGHPDHSGIWDSIKDSWRNSEPGDCYISDDEGEQLFDD
jgi:hypothetical protein